MFVTDGCIGYGNGWTPHLSSSIIIRFFVRPPFQKQHKTICEQLVKMRTLFSKVLGNHETGAAAAAAAAVYGDNGCISPIDGEIDTSRRNHQLKASVLLFPIWKSSGVTIDYNNSDTNDNSMNKCDHHDIDDHSVGGGNCNLTNSAHHGCKSNNNNNKSYNSRSRSRSSCNSDMEMDNDSEAMVSSTRSLNVSMRLPRLTGIPSQSYKSISDIGFQFDKLMDDRDARALFMKFLVSGRSEDALLFIEAVDVFEMLQDPIVQYKMALDIYKKFIAPTSDNEINLSSDFKYPIQQYFESLLSNEESSKLQHDSITHSTNARLVPPEVNTNIFAKAKLAIFKQLKEHSFPMFIKSETFQNYMNQQSREYIEFLSTPSGLLASPRTLDNRVNVTESFAYSLDPTAAPAITDKDIFFFLKTRRGLHSERQRIVLNKNDFVCYISKKLIDMGHPGSKEMMLTATVGVVDFPIKGVMNTLLDTSIANNNQQEKEELLGEIKKIPKKSDSYSMAITRRSVTHSIPTLSKRDYCLCNTCVFDPHRNCFIIASKSCHDSRAPPQENWIRSAMVGALIFERIDSMRTRYINILYLDVGNKSQEKLFESSYKSKSELFHKQLLLKLQRNSQWDFPEPKYSDGILSTLLDFERNYLEDFIQLGECPWDTLHKQYDKN